MDEKKYIKSDAKNKNAMNYILFGLKFADAAELRMEYQATHNWP